MSRVFLGLMLAGAASAFVCDTQLDVVSAACCVGGSSSRRMQVADLSVCTLPSKARPAPLIALLPFYTTRECPPSLLILQGNVLLPF